MSAKEYKYAVVSAYEREMESAQPLFDNLEEAAKAMCKEYVDYIHLIDSADIVEKDIGEPFTAEKMYAMITTDTFRKDGYGFGFKNDMVFGKTERNYYAWSNLHGCLYDIAVIRIAARTDGKGKEYEN